jgi:hypothetical protein
VPSEDRVHTGRGGRPDVLADIRHGRLVALAFADDDGPSHLDTLEGVAHGPDCGLIGGVGSASPHGAGGGNGRLTTCTKSPSYLIRATPVTDPDGT